MRVTVRDRSPDESAAFLSMPSGSVLFSQTLSKSEVLGTSSYLEIAQKNYGEMFGGVLPERDRLYGTHLAVEYELLDAQGNGVTIDNRVPGRFNDNFYVYRWIDAVGEGKAFGLKDAAAVFHEKTTEGLGGVKPQKEVDVFVPSSVQTNFAWTGSSDFTADTVSNNKVLFEYNPDLSNVNSNEVVQKPITLEVNKGIKIGQFVASVQPPLKFDDYWLPSTDTLNLLPKKREELFERIFSNFNVDKYYLDVLASQGPTVNLPYPQFPQPYPDFPKSILPRQGDAMIDFDKALEKRQILFDNQGSIYKTVVPWLEGTGRIANQGGFHDIYKAMNAISHTATIEGGTKFHYIDLFTGESADNPAWMYFIAFVRAFCEKYITYKGVYDLDFVDFTSLIVDDHFGIYKDSKNIEEMIKRLKARDARFKDETDDTVLRRQLANLVSDRIRDLSNVLWYEYGLGLSVSVNPFDFKKAANTNPTSWHNALNTNFHDVARWIDESYIRGDRGGEINVQIYRDEPWKVIAEYDKFYNNLKEHLEGKSAAYMAKFPKIAVSLAAEGSLGGGWKASRDDIEEILTHISQKNPVKTEDGKEVTIRVSAFDGDDFHRLSA